MYRGGVDRRDFLRLGAAALGASWVGAPADGLSRAAARLAAPSPPANRSFNILAFGDSVMWGQGLAANQKFASLVRDWVQTQLPGREVTLGNYAHSGAIIEPNAVRDVGVFGSEVPDSYPSITGQVWRALDVLTKTKPFAPTEVDLVLLDGGINDVDLLNILDPTASAADVRELTRDRLGTRMKYLLPIVTGTFPTAKVVVTGYFKVVSDNSDVPELAAALGVIGLVVGVPLLVALYGGLKGKLVEQCAAFYDESVTQLRDAVAIENARTPDRCRYVDPGFTDMSAYGASGRLLYKIGEVDPVADARAAQCNASGNQYNVKCIDASMGHPNVAGARQYANAINSALTRYVSGWLGLRHMVTCIEPKPVMGKPMTYVVFAEDAETRQALAGTVSMDSGATFPTNTPFTYTFAACQRTVQRQTSKLPSVDVPDCEMAYVGAPGYVGAGVDIR